MDHDAGRAGDVPVLMSGTTETTLGWPAQR